MKYIAVTACIFFLACSGSQKLASGNQSTLPQNTSLNGKLFTALFQQRAGEYRGLCLQAYNIARFRIDNFSAQSKMPKAIITDIDETILDNSPYAVHRAYKGTEYDLPSWYEWTGMGAADTMPGAASLLKYAASKNVSIFYVTNRDENERPGTLKNLQHFNLPNADNDHLVMKTSSSSKEERRKNIMKNHEVILLMGDNLADFSDLFDKKPEDVRKSNVDIASGEFGKKFIIFPNSNYGDWESSLYKLNYKLTQAQKDSVIKSVLKNY